MVASPGIANPGPAVPGDCHPRLPVPPRLPQRLRNAMRSNAHREVVSPLNAEAPPTNPGKKTAIKVPRVGMFERSLSCRSIFPPNAPVPQFQFFPPAFTLAGSSGRTVVGSDSIRSSLADLVAFGEFNGDDGNADEQQLEPALETDKGDAYPAQRLLSPTPPPPLRRATRNRNRQSLIQPRLTVTPPPTADPIPEQAPTYVSVVPPMLPRYPRRQSRVIPTVLMPAPLAEAPQALNNPMFDQEDLDEAPVQQLPAAIRPSEVALSPSPTQQRVHFKEDLLDTSRLAPLIESAPRQASAPVTTIDDLPVAPLHIAEPEPPERCFSPDMPRPPSSTIVSRDTSPTGRPGSRSRSTSVSPRPLSVSPVLYAYPMLTANERHEALSRPSLKERPPSVNSSRSGTSAGGAGPESSTLLGLAHWRESAAERQEQFSELIKYVDKLVAEGKVVDSFHFYERRPRITAQVNRAMYTPEVLEARLALKGNLQLREHILRFWDAIKKEDRSHISKATYYELFGSIMDLFHTGHRQEDRQVVLERDWVQDTGSLHAISMTKIQFCEALFDLVDTWVPTAELADYIHLLERLERLVLPHHTQPTRSRLVDRLTTTIHTQFRNSPHRWQPSPTRRRGGVDFMLSPSPPPGTLPPRPRRRQQASSRSPSRQSTATTSGGSGSSRNASPRPLSAESRRSSRASPDVPSFMAETSAYAARRASTSTATSARPSSSGRSPRDGTRRKASSEGGQFPSATTGKRELNPPGGRPIVEPAPRPVSLATLARAMDGLPMTTFSNTALPYFVEGGPPLARSVTATPGGASTVTFTASATASTVPESVGYSVASSHSGLASAAKDSFAIYRNAHRPQSAPPPICACGRRLEHGNQSTKGSCRFCQQAPPDVPQGATRAAEDAEAALAELKAEANRLGLVFSSPPPTDLAAQTPVSVIPDKLVVTA